MCCQDANDFLKAAKPTQKLHLIVDGQKMRQPCPVDSSGNIAWYLHKESQYGHKSPQYEFATIKTGRVDVHNIGHTTYQVSFTQARKGVSPQRHE